jgi:hypothetical protein
MEFLLRGAIIGILALISYKYIYPLLMFIFNKELIDDTLSILSRVIILTFLIVMNFIVQQRIQRFLTKKILVLSSNNKNLK